MMDNKFWMQVFAVIVAMLLMSWVVRPVLSNVLGVKEGWNIKKKSADLVLGAGLGDF